jgi:hypothetical protein
MLRGREPGTRVDGPESVWGARWHRSLLPLRHDPAYWRQRASEARRMADDLTDPAARQAIREVAASYERLHAASAGDLGGTKSARPTLSGRRALSSASASSSRATTSRATMPMKSRTCTTCTARVPVLCRWVSLLLSPTLLLSPPPLARPRLAGEHLLVLAATHDKRDRHENRRSRTGCPAFRGFSGRGVMGACRGSIAPKVLGRHAHL